MGQYSVTLLVEGFPPSHAGTITVYEGSRPGTLNDFLGAMTEDDVRPEALRRFEQMVEEVSRNASAVAQNTAAAKNQPAMPVHQPARGGNSCNRCCSLITCRQHVSRTGRVVGSVSVFQRRNGIDKGP